MTYALTLYYINLFLYRITVFSSGSLFLRPKTVSSLSQNKDGQQILQAQLSPPGFGNKVVGIQVVADGSQHPNGSNTFTMQTIKQESQPMSIVPMETQNAQRNQELSRTSSGEPPSTFHFMPAAKAVQIVGSTSTSPGSAATGHQNLTTSVPGQRVITAPDVQFRVRGAESFPDNKLNKDELLQKQQKEIEDLRRMVELHRTQLHQFQNEKKYKDGNSSNNNTSNSNQITVRFLICLLRS